MRIFYLVPKNLLSYFTGWISRAWLPWPLNIFFCSIFAKLFGIQLDEAEKPLKNYQSIEELFTRRLKEGLRPIGSRFVSPVDGILSVSAAVERPDSALQAKGLTYSIKELVFGNLSSDTQLKQNDDAFFWYTTIYLAPRHYHRVHAPASAFLKQITYIPGNLWPVNQLCLPWLPRLFNRNERLIFHFETAQKQKFWLVMVGALNVGRMTTPFWAHFATNSLRRQFCLNSINQGYQHLNTEVKVEVGQEIGTFMLGSTVVLVLSKGLHSESKYILDTQSPRPVLMGQTLLKN